LSADDLHTHPVFEKDHLMARPEPAGHLQRLCRRALRAGLACSLFPAIALAQQAAPPGSDTFRSLMDAAMTRMDQGMAVSYSGDADRDFAAMMIPHHQGAIDMAEAELRFGHDERLRRLAQGIIVEQTQEIAVMRQILSSLRPAPTGGAESPMHDMHD
jgi:hypothetical protein